MALLRVNAVGDIPGPHRSLQPLGPMLRRVLAGQDGAVTILLHGYKYRPGEQCPHDHIFALSPNNATPRVVSWPHHLGYGQDRPAPGVLICFGWDARGRVQAAYGRASEAGQALARLVRDIRAIDPGRTVNVLSHSMGARVALQAMQHLPKGAMDRLILMAAAEYTGEVRKALDSPAGRHAQVLHVTSRENDLYDFLLERCVRPEQRGDRALGTQQDGLPNLRNLWLDDGRTLEALAGLGYRIAPPQRRICHWSPYLRPGVFALYAALLSGDLSMIRLDQVLPRIGPSRWCRLRPALRFGLPVSTGSRRVV